MTLRKKDLTQLVFFLIAGTIGFFVDVIILYQLVGLLGLYLARLLSFSGAVFSTWIINRSFTFQNHSRENNIIGEFVSYYSFMILGGIINYIAFLAVVWIMKNSPHKLLIAVSVGSISGMAINYWSSKNFVFNRQILK